MAKTNKLPVETLEAESLNELKTKIEGYRKDGTLLKIQYIRNYLHKTEIKQIDSSKEETFSVIDCEILLIFADKIMQLTAQEGHNEWFLDEIKTLLEEFGSDQSLFTLVGTSRHVKYCGNGRGSTMWCHYQAQLLFMENVPKEDLKKFQFIFKPYQVLTPDLFILKDPYTQRSKPVVYQMGFDIFSATKPSHLVGGQKAASTLKVGNDDSDLYFGVGCIGFQNIPVEKRNLLADIICDGCMKGYASLGKKQNSRKKCKNRINSVIEYMKPNPVENAPYKLLLEL